MNSPPKDSSPAEHNGQPSNKVHQKIMSENKCELQLVQPHNHRVNAAERAIQKFKDAFIAALASTDINFPIKLWDKLTP
jgi:hypothetical protein